MAEKIRYFLEKALPEVQDLQDKGLFDKREATMIMRRRTDFEHRILARGSKPKDFMRYIEFESNLERLRVKRFHRYKRVNAVDTRKSISDYAGIKRINFIYDRAVARFPDDLALWSSYLLFAKKNQSVPIVYKIYTQVLQIHPRKIKFWVSAADYEFENNSNAKAARTLFQKGLRFNPDSLELWIAYAEFELLYVTKLLERRRILGLLTEKKQAEAEAQENKELEDKLELPEDDGEIRESLNQLPEADMNMLGNPETNPALRGDIALTVFDIAMKTLLGEKKEESKFVVHSRKDLVLKYAKEFLAVFDKFAALNRTNLAGHVISFVLNEIPDNSEAKLLDITLPLRYDTCASESFVDDLKLSVNKYMAYKQKEGSNDLAVKYVDYLKERFITEDTTDTMKGVLESIIFKISK